MRMGFIDSRGDHSGSFSDGSYAFAEVCERYAVDVETLKKYKLGNTDHGAAFARLLNLMGQAGYRYMGKDESDNMIHHFGCAYKFEKIVEDV